MKVLKTVGVWVACGAATTLGAILIQKSVNVVANSCTKAKVTSAFDAIKSKFKKAKN